MPCARAIADRSKHSCYQGGMTALLETPATSLEPPRAAGIRRLTRMWLAVLFVLGLGYMALVPPFQAVDEVAHWDRVWSVASGDYNCKKIPKSAADFVELSFRFDNRQIPPQPVSWSLFREAYQHTGSEGSFWIATNGCHYPPIGYLPAAAAVRAFTPGPIDAPRPHKMFIGFYVARLANWLFFFACVTAAVCLVPYPLPVLVFASIPMVVHQAVSLNNDAFQFGGLLVLLALVTGSPTRARLWSAIAILALLSAIKPINAIAAPVVWFGAWLLRSGHGIRRLEYVLMLLSSIGLPVGAWLLWNATMHMPVLGLSTDLVVANVDQSAQLARLRDEPLRFFQVLYGQLSQLFTAPPINGGWRGIVLALGWYRYEAPGHVYVLALAAFVLGVSTLRLRDRHVAPGPGMPRILVTGVVAAVAAYFVVVTMTLYLAFTPVASEVVYGVQGRYFLYPLALILFVVPLARPARGEGEIGRGAWLRVSATVALSTAANAATLYAIRWLFWEA